MTDADKTILALTETEKARFDVAKSGISALAAEAADGVITEESIGATFNQLGQLDIDIPRLIN